MFTEFKHLLRSLTGENTVIELEEEFKEAELGPPEQYIEFLLKDHGGHLRQQEILTAVEWSAGTVSRKLSRMEEQGRVRRVRVGREKHVYLPEQLPEWLHAGYTSESQEVGFVETLKR